MSCASPFVITRRLIATSDALLDRAKFKTVGDMIARAEGFCRRGASLTEGFCDCLAKDFAEIEAIDLDEAVGDGRPA